MGFPFDTGKWLEQKKPYFMERLNGQDLPFINVGKILKDYDKINSKSPYTLWKLLCYALWNISNSD